MTEATIMEIKDMYHPALCFSLLFNPPGREGSKGGGATLSPTPGGVLYIKCKALSISDVHSLYLTQAWRVGHSTWTEAA